jgi:hypothetical protein
MSQTRNYDGTGASEGGGGAIYCTGHSKEGKFKIKKVDIGSIISGYVDSMQVLKDEGNPDENIAAGWKVRVLVSVKDDERGTEENGVKIATYTMEFSMVAQGSTSSFLNVVAATTIDWDGYIRMAWYKPDNSENCRLSVYTSKRHSVDNKPPLHREFLNNETHMFVGIPKGKEIGKDPTNGKPILDYRETQNAWLGVAIEVAKRFGQTDFPIGPRAEGKFYGKDGYWGEGVSAAPSAPGAPAATDFVSKYLLSVENKIKSAGTEEALKATTVLMEQHKPADLSWDDLQAAVNKFLAAHPTFNTWVFNATLKAFYHNPPPAQPAGPDDLPF